MKTPEGRIVMQKHRASICRMAFVVAALLAPLVARAGERKIQYSGAAPDFRYAGADLDDSATVRRTFAWFAEDGTKESSFSLTLPRNVDRLVDTDAGEDYVRPVELLMAEYPRKPFLHLWASGFPVSYWPSPETLPYARRVGAFRDGEDDFVVYAVAREEVHGKSMSHGAEVKFDGVLLYARGVPEAKGTRMRVTDMVARRMLPDREALESALDELRKHWTSCPGAKVIGNLFKERVTPEIARQNLLVWEDKRKGVFAHWENAEDGGFALYMVLTDKWGYKGGVNRRVHGNPEAATARLESPTEALVRGAKEYNGELVVAALAKGADPNGPVERNITPLGAAVDGLVIPNVEILRLLLEAGADPNRKWGDCGTTPFYSIVQSSCWGRKTQEELAAFSEGIRLMLKHGADPNKVQGMFGHSPLSYAIMRGADLVLVKILVEGGGVVTDKMVEDAKDNPEILEYLKSKKQSGEGESMKLDRPEELFGRAHAAYKRDEYDKSFPIFKKLAEEGFEKAYGYVGLAYELGEGTGKDQEKAIQWYEKAIDAKEHVGVYRLGMIYRKMGRDDLAFGVYKRAADGNFATGNDQLQLGEMLERGVGTKRDFQQAAGHYRIAASSAVSFFDKKKAREALERLGELYHREDFDITLPDNLRNAAPDVLYARGKKALDDFDSPDEPFAFACFKAAAEKGHTMAACKLARMYAKKLSPIFDEQKAAEYRQRASDGLVDFARENPSFAFEAGFAYMYGTGCEKNAVRAEECFLIGEKHQDVSCLWQLGLIREKNGRNEEAFGYFLKAAEMGQGMAMYELAQCYERGKGCARDTEKAIHWYRLCSKSTYASASDAERRLAELTRQKGTGKVENPPRRQFPGNGAASCSVSSSQGDALCVFDNSENDGKLPYLLTSAEIGDDKLKGNDIEMHAVSIKEGNFEISLLPGFETTPETKTFEPFKGSDIDCCMSWTFRECKGGDASRVDVSYLRKAGEKPFLDDKGAGIIAFDNKVTFPVEMGIGPFVAVLGEDIDVVERGKPRIGDRTFAEKHGATGFSSCFALVRVNGMLYRVFQVSLVGEREAWRIQTMLPSQLGLDDHEVDGKTAMAFDSWIAGEILGRFRVLDAKVGFANLEWTVGGFKAATDVKEFGVSVSSLRFDGKTLCVDWEKGKNPTAWGMSWDEASAAACLFLRHEDGSWKGGQIGWISAKESSVSVRDVLSERRGWSLKGVPKPCEVAFVVFRKDGKRRSNVTMGTWNR